MLPRGAPLASRLDCTWRWHPLLTLQVAQLIVVNLKVRYCHRLFCRIGALEQLKYGVNCTWYDACKRWVISLALHCVSFARSRLPIGKHGTVKTLQNATHNRLYRHVENIFLRT